MKTNEERIKNGTKVLRDLINKSDTPLYRKWITSYLDLVEAHMKNCKSGETSFDVDYEQAKEVFTGLTEEEGEVPVS